MIELRYNNPEADRLGLFMAAVGPLIHGRIYAMPEALAEDLLRLSPETWQAAGTDPGDLAPIEWSEVSGVGHEIGQALIGLGIVSRSDLRQHIEEQGTDQIEAIPGIGAARLQKIVEFAGLDPEKEKEE